MNKPFHYRGYGLTVASDFELPEMTPADPVTPDVTIHQGDIARQAREATIFPVKAHAGCYMSPAGPMLSVGDTADFLVRNGNRIDVTLQPDADPATMRLFLMGSCMGLIFHQRGELVLHGAAIGRGDKVSVFVGDSGAGKSTLAAHLGRRGYAVLSDDTLPLRRGRDGGFVAWPGSSAFKLWRVALEGMGMDAAGLAEVGARQDKYYMQNPNTAPDQPHDLVEIITLEQTENSVPTLTALDGAEALSAVAQNVYRHEFAGLLDREADQFRQSAELLAACRVLRLNRPWGADRIDECIDFLEVHWRTGNSAMR
ncbi:MAG: hypothetical protein AAF439_03540 [Pseudomonadota bacterium]